MSKSHLLYGISSEYYELSESETIDFSQLNDKSIVGWVDNDTLRVQSEDKIIANEILGDFTLGGSLNKGMFTDMINVETIILNNFYTYNTVDMSMMFHTMYALEMVNLGENFDTTNVQEMSGMFLYTKLETLDLGDKFNTTSLIDTQEMFMANFYIKNLSLGDSFYTTNLEKSPNMFIALGATVKTELLDLGPHFVIREIEEVSNFFAGTNIGTLKVSSVEDKEFVEENIGLLGLLETTIIETY